MLKLWLKLSILKVGNELIYYQALANLISLLLTELIKELIFEVQMEAIMALVAYTKS